MKSFGAGKWGTSQGELGRKMKEDDGKWDGKLSFSM